MSEIKVESGIPMPSRSTGKYPLKVMIKGDSFFIPADVTTNYLQANLFSSAKRAGIKISTRSVDGGLRVWRVE